MALTSVQKVNEKFPQLLKANTFETDAHFLYFVCQELGPDWQLLGKSRGETGYSWPNGVRTSHDAICRVDASGSKIATVDVIVSAGGNQPTRPDWNEVPSHEWRPDNKPVPLSAISPPPSVGGVNPTPCPDPARHTKPDCPNPRAHDAKQYVGDDVGSELGRALFDDYASANQSPNPGMGVWFLRVSHDVVQGGMSKDEAIKKHRNEWRRALGLPQL